MEPMKVPGPKAPAIIERDQAVISLLMQEAIHL